MKRKRNKPDDLVKSKLITTTGNTTVKSPIYQAASATSRILREVPIHSEDIDIEDVIFYAKHIGIDPLSEPQLLPIAQAGLLSPLPPGWLPVEDHKGRLYYFDAIRGQSCWEHPNDSHYRKLVRHTRRRALANRSQAESLSTACGGIAGVGTMSEFTNSSFSLSNLHFFDDYDEDNDKDQAKQQNNRNGLQTKSQTTKDKQTKQEPVSNSKKPVPEVVSEIEEVDDDEQIESIELEIESEIIEEIEDEDLNSENELSGGNGYNQTRKTSNNETGNVRNRLDDVFDSLDNQVDDQMNNLVSKDPFADEESQGGQDGATLDQIFGFKHNADPSDRPRSAMANHRQTSGSGDNQQTNNGCGAELMLAKQLSVLEEGDEEEAAFDEFDQIADMVDNFDDSSSTSEDHRKQPQPQLLRKESIEEVNNYDEDEFEQESKESDIPKMLEADNFRYITTKMNQQIAELKQQFREELDKQSIEIQTRIDKQLQSFVTNEREKWTLTLEKQRDQFGTMLEESSEKQERQQDNKLRLVQQTISTEIEAKAQQLNQKLDQQLNQLNSDLQQKLTSRQHHSAEISNFQEETWKDLLRKESEKWGKPFSEDIAKLRQSFQKNEDNYRQLEKTIDKVDNKLEDKLTRLEQRLIELQKDEQRKRQEEFDRLERKQTETALQSHDTSIKVGQQILEHERTQLDKRFEMIQNQIDQLTRQFNTNCSTMQQQNSDKPSDENKVITETRTESPKPESLLDLPSSPRNQKRLTKKLVDSTAILDDKKEEEQKKFAKIAAEEEPRNQVEHKVLLQDCVQQLNQAIQMFREETGDRSRNVVSLGKPGRNLQHQRHHQRHHRHSFRKQTNKPHNNLANKKIQRYSEELQSQINVSNQENETIDPGSSNSTITTIDNLSTCSTALAGIGPDQTTAMVQETNRLSTESELSFPEEYHYRQSSHNRWKSIGATSSSSSVHKRMSRSTPNLEQPGRLSQQQQQHPRPYQSHQRHSQTSHSTNNRLLHQELNSPVIGNRTRSNQNLPRFFDQNLRAPDVESSSGSLIRLIQQTSGQLKRELNELQKLGTWENDVLIGQGTGPRTGVLGSVSLQLTKTLQMPSQNGTSHEDQDQDDDRILIQKLKSIRNTVNQRLQKISVAIEQQKTTRI